MGFDVLVDALQPQLTDHLRRTSWCRVAGAQSIDAKTHTPLNNRMAAALLCSDFLGLDFLWLVYSMGVRAGWICLRVMLCSRS